MPHTPGPSDLPSTLRRIADLTDGAKTGNFTVHEPPEVPHLARHALAKAQPGPSGCSARDYGDGCGHDHSASQPCLVAGCPHAEVAS